MANFKGNVIRALAAGSHGVLVPHNDEHVERVRAMGAEFEPWAVSGRDTLLWREGSDLLALHDIYRRLKPDLAFHFTTKAGNYRSTAARCTCTAVVSVITAVVCVCLNSGMASTMARSLYRRKLR